MASEAILVITGNLQIGATSIALPTIARLPFELRKIQGYFLLQYPASPEEGGVWRARQSIAQQSEHHLAQKRDN